MFAIAILPLALYFAFLTRLHFRQTPTVIDGSLDFTLLAWGLFGLISLGPGRLIIPIYVFTAWGIFTWLFWCGFYFSVVHLFAKRFNNRLVVYHCQRELVLPAFFILAQKIDPKTEWSGHVLSFHGLGVQWSVTHDRFGGHLQFIPTNPYIKNPHQKMLQKQLACLCQTLVMPKRKIRWFWGILTSSLLCLVIGLLFRDFETLVFQFGDYWL